MAKSTPPTDVSAERKRFEALTAHLEGVALRNPVGYNRRVAALAMLGYAYIFAVLIACLAVLAALVAVVVFGHRIHVALIKIGFFIAVFMFIVIKSLFVKIEPPEGRELKREEAPQLFAHIDEIREKLDAPQPHHVLFTDEFNAAVSQVPRFGLFGGYRNYLIVGLQLMSTLSPAEFKSVLAHEFGHLSGNHSRFSGWIYRVRRSWMNVMEQVGDDNFVFSKFFHWYAPYFGAYSFVLARQNEYVADRCAAELCGARIAADSLTRGAVVGGYLSEEFWPKLFRRANREEEPPAQIYNNLSSAVSSSFESDVAQRWLTEAVCRPTDTVDTHPSLSQRLASLKEEPRYQPREGISAAEFYFGDKLGPLTAELESKWHQGVAPMWKELHGQLSEARQKLDEIEAKAKDGPLTDEEQWQRADATEDFGDEDAAFTLFEEYLAAHPTEAKAEYSVGRLLLKRGDETGLEHLERAINLDHQATQPACQIAESFLLQRSQTEAAGEWRERGLQYEDKVRFAQAERNGARPGDNFLPHNLPADEVQSLRDHFAAHESVQEVLVVRKEVQHFPDLPLYIIGVGMVKKKFSISNDEEKRTQALQAALNELKFDHQCLLLQLDSESGKAFKKPLEKVENSVVFQR